MRKFLLALIALAAVAACAPFPQIDAMGRDAAPPPALLPIGDLLAQAGPDTPDPAPAIQSRAARLTSRAAAIGAPTAQP
jgi:hypothetical protein